MNDLTSLEMQDASVLMGVIALGVITVLVIIIANIRKFFTGQESRSRVVHMGGADILITALRFDQVPTRQLQRLEEKYRDSDTETDDAVYDLILRELANRSKTRTLERIR